MTSLRRVGSTVHGMRPASGARVMIRLGLVDGDLLLVAAHSGEGVDMAAIEEGECMNHA